MTTAQIRQQIRDTHPTNIANMKLSNYGAAGRLMSRENTRGHRFHATGHTFEMSFSCGHTRVIQVEAADAGTQRVANPCSHCSAFGIFA